MNKLKLGLFLLTTVPLLGLISCSDENPWGGTDERGSIALNLSTDGRILRHSTKSDDATSPIIPDGNAFTIHLTHVDGSYSKTWTNVDAFNNEESFPIGDYKLKAEFGDIEREGFELPYFKGEEDVHVSPGSTSEVSVSAVLANAMVSVRYTDTFIDNFRNYSAAVQTPGHDWVVFAQSESRPAYINPESSDYTKVSITMTNNKGETVTVEPAKFQTLPRHHYIVTINATGNVSSGNLTLEVEFEDDVVNETVDISLTDELFTSPAPEIKPKNFTDKEELTYIEYEDIVRDPQFDILAFGGFQEVNFTVASSDNYTPSFGKSVELVGSSALIRRQLESSGVKVSGLYPVAGLMAVINVKEFLQQLPAGTYTLTVQAKDVMTRLSEPVVLKAIVTPLQVAIFQSDEIHYRATEISVVVASNSSHLANNLSFKVSDNAGDMIDAEVVEITPTTVDGYNSAKKFKLSTPPIIAAEVIVETSVGHVTKNVTIDIADPEYTVDVDAFARYVVFKISCDDEDLRQDLIQNLGIYNGTTRIKEDRITRNEENGFIIVNNVASHVTYSGIKTVLGNFEKSIPLFTTEDETDVTNGSFSLNGTNLNPAVYLQVGGKYRAGAFDYYNRVMINLFEPRGWATVNALTCANSSTNKNTWFMVPSTYLNNGEVVIRSVGYNHAGTTPARSGGFANRNYYCENSPSNEQLDKAAGELFLGSYTQGGTRTNGINFGARPSCLNFSYKYTTHNGEQAQVDIKVYDKDGAVIASNTEYLSAQIDMTDTKVMLPSYPYGKKAAKIYIGFRSTKEGVTPDIHIPTGSELQENGVSLNTNYYFTLPENNYHALATGSVLTIDNVSLGYEEVTNITPAPRRNSKR